MCYSTAPYRTYASFLKARYVSAAWLGLGLVFGSDSHGLGLGLASRGVTWEGFWAFGLGEFVWWRAGEGGGEGGEQGRMGTGEDGEERGARGEDGEGRDVYINTIRYVTWYEKWNWRFLFFFKRDFLWSFFA